MLTTIDLLKKHTYNYNMNVERIYNILISEYNTDKLKIEEELERIINTHLEINKKTKKIKTLLNELVANEIAIGKIKEMFAIENK